MSLNKKQIKMKKWKMKKNAKKHRKKPNQNDVYGINKNTTYQFNITINVLYFLNISEPLFSHYIPHII